MARIVLETGTAADPAALIEALTTAKGIAAWWTDDVDYAGGAETSMRLGFPVAPLPFELTVERVTDDNVVWRSTGAFPPHWADTTMSWTVAPDGEGSTVSFTHDGWASDDGPFAGAAYTWAQLLGTLTGYAETGTEGPLFARAG